MTYKDWIVVLLTILFVVLYVLALTGVLQPPSNDKLVVQIAPIISVIIGYYFGRMPGEKNEQALQQQVTAAQGERRQAETDRSAAQVQRERVVTLIGAAKEALRTAVPGASPQQLAATLGGGGAGKPDPDAVRMAAASALNVLEKA